MQTRVDQVVFERTSFGSFGWLTPNPPELLLQLVAPNAQRADFRVPDRTNTKDLYHYGGQLQNIEYIQKYLDNVWTTAKFAGTESQLRSFRVPIRQNRDAPYYQDQPVFSWLKDVLDLEDAEAVSTDREWGGWDDVIKMEAKARDVEMREVVEIITIIAQKFIL